jgi:hypothetical protein
VQGVFHFGAIVGGHSTSPAQFEQSCEQTLLLAASRDDAIKVRALLCRAGDAPTRHFQSLANRLLGHLPDLVIVTVP